MSEFEKTPFDSEAGSDEIARLIRFGGARETVDNERFAGAHDRVNEHWQTVVRTRRQQQQRRLLGQLAVAASVIAVIGVSLLTFRAELPPAGGNPVLVDRVIGDVLVDGAQVRPGEPVPDDSGIETLSNGRIALRLPDGKSVRLDTSSSVIIADAGHLQLDRGAVYIDSGAGPDKSPVAVATRFGVARDIGTQFQVRISDERLRVGVREGLVEISRTDAETLPVQSGTALEISADGSSRAIEVTGSDSSWEWVEEIVPGYDIDGATLEEYLGWFARQRGLALEWDEPGSRARAGSIRLSGSIAGMSLDQGFEFVRRIAPFDFETTQRAIRVRVQ